MVHFNTAMYHTNFIMEYEKLIELITKRISNNIKPTLTEDEARLYYGDKTYLLIKKIFNNIKNTNNTLYQHATDLVSAENIAKHGFIVENGEEIKEKNFQDGRPIDIIIDDNGTKIVVYSGKKCDIRYSGIRDELADTQHFFENIECNLDFGEITYPNINRSGFGATCLFVVSNDVKGSRECEQYCIKESHYDEWDDEIVPEQVYKRTVIPRELCLGFVDVKNKQFVFNPNFQFRYLVQDEFELGTTSHNEDNIGIEHFGGLSR